MRFRCHFQRIWPGFFHLLELRFIKSKKEKGYLNICKLRQMPGSMRKIPYNFINIGCNGIENNMKKRGAPLKKEVKEFVLEEEDVLFSLLDFDVSKKHFFSFASIVFSLAIGLSMVNSIQKQGNVLGIWFVGIAFVFALLVVKVMV